MPLVSVDRENYLGLIGERDDAERERDRLNQEVLNLETRLAQAERALGKADAVMDAAGRLVRRADNERRYTKEKQATGAAIAAYRTERKEGKGG